MAKALLAAVLLAALALAGGATATGDAFTGAWKATDQFDGSTLRLEIGSASATGERRISVTDGYASGCGAPATAIGTGTAAGATLTATLDVRCGGELRAEDVPFTFSLSGGTLLGIDTTFTRVTQDEFAGAWVAIDPFDASNLRLQIGSPSASGNRQVTLTDDHASACGAPATAIGTGTVAGSTLTTIVDVRCGGELRAEGVTITYELVGDTLTDGFSTFVRVRS